MSSVSAGMSQLVAAILRLCFTGEHNMSSAGLALIGPGGEHHRLWCSLSMVLQDGAAHKSVWHCKGDAGTKICMLCRNLYSEKSGIVDQDGHDMLTCNIVHEGDLDMAVDADILGSVRRLAAQHGNEPAALFAKREQAVGFRHMPHGLLLDERLLGVVRPASQFCHDYMHAIFVNGVFNTIAFAFIECFLSAGMKDVWEILEGYIKLWQWPKRVHDRALPEVFSKKHVAACRKSGQLKCSASEGLSLYPVMAMFTRSVLLPTGACTTGCQAFLALAEVLDQLLAIPLGIVPPRELQRSIASFLDACIAAKWRSLMHPKFHWLVHLPQHLASWGTLPTCWVHERRHKMVKRYAGDIRNTSNYERSVLKEVAFFI